MLIDRLKAFFEATASAQNTGDARALELACAALMLEVARADFNIDRSEREKIERLLGAHFDLTEEEIATLHADAAQRVDLATCLFEFTRTINDLASVETKRHLVFMMWQVALADEELSRYEEHVIRKVSDLLYLPHSDFIRARETARKA